ncbi:bifunctional phosphoribosylaminoimidazolecarboxamide formyltransferase/IMP cyclohydrolase [Mycobacterium spongiae]|uniref:Bifunctional purine biosynthesis protein PurH n=1 Tax=Mycobacterium spongiae TaxID=886343 RepID=A0A975K293_9MYCO|nr:bifunctional phosphoribosylaminoimidazolecarboxamide formyltransferase/IMP cyclohydrolase [Mycobacterium spongiae]QUR68768.1 bifunctional phosphoribosylaminoimidazolecarboxamide formyltransferase/IMP cyclohydrolase [Mycobacterium spongiae]
MSTDDGRDLTRRPIRRALISVYDKTGLTALAQSLSAAGVEIVSTGSTAKTIAASGIPVTPVEELTGFPEVLDGRVKTLHPRVHAGLLADLRRPEHAAALEQLGIEAFELVVVNLYPFSQTVESGAGVDECVEQIDIGGPSMVRAAAKNHPSVAVVTDPLGYDGVLAAVRGGGFTLAERKRLAALAFQRTAEYDIAVAGWMLSTLSSEQPEQPEAAFPEWLGGTWRRSAMLRYGENPHQAAALYGDPAAWPGLAQAEQLHGKEMSYNNFTDADAAWRAAFDHEQTCVAIIKHANPCGIAISSISVADAHRKAHDCDPLSAYGGVIAANTEVSEEMAEYVSTIFTEVIIAPAYAPGALDALTRKKNIRVLVAPEPLSGGIEVRQVSGGLLMQQRDQLDASGDNPANWKLAAGSPASPAMLTDLVFAWRTCRAVKSNAIVIVADGATIGVGMGQVNRVDAARLAVERGGERVGGSSGSVAASDAFFPFPDGLETLAAAGVKAIVHPGGSVRDDEVTEAAAKAGVTLYLTGARHFAH